MRKVDDLSLAFNDNIPDIPDSYICIITQLIMYEPVITEDGYIYEKEAIEEWLKKHNTSPNTNLPLSTKSLILVRPLRSDIEGFLNKYPDLYAQGMVYFAKHLINKCVSAIKANNLNEIKELINKDIRCLSEPLENNYTALHLALEFGTLDLANMLFLQLEQKNKLATILEYPLPENFKPTFIHHLLSDALDNKHKQRFEALCILNTNSEQVLNELLLTYVKEDNIASVLWLIEAGSNLNCFNKEGNTPLHLSILQKHDNISEYLIKQGAKEQINNDGNTQLHLAVDQGLTKTIQILLEAGFDCNKKNKQGKTPRDLLDQYKQKNRLRVTLAGHQDKVTCVLPLKNGNLLSGSWDKTIRLWNITTGDCISILKGHTHNVTYLAELDNGKIVSGSTDGSVRLWNINTGICIKQLTSNSVVRALYKLTNGGLAIGYKDGSINILDENLVCSKILKGHKDSLSCLLQLNNGILVSGAWDNSIKFWNLNRGGCINTITGHTKPIMCLLELANGNLVSAGKDKSIKFWDLNTNQCYNTISDHTDTVNCLVQLANGDIISSSWDKSIKLRNSQGKTLSTILGHASVVNELKDMNGGLISCSDDKTIKVWNVDLLVTNLEVKHIPKTFSLNSFSLN